MSVTDQPVPLGPPVRRQPPVRAASAPSAQPSQPSVSIAVGGMTCGSCAAKIERHLNTLAGVEARVNYATERAMVQAPADYASADLLREIEGLGYSAELLADARAARSGTLGPEAAVGGRPATAFGADAALDRRVRSLRRRLVLAAVLFMPLCDTSLAFSLFPAARVPGWQWILLVLSAPVVTWAAWPFHQAAIRHARHGSSTMDTLVSLGIIASSVWSVYAMFFEDIGNARGSLAAMLTHHSGGSIYLDVAAGVTTFLLAGRYFEARSRQRSGDALRSLAALGAKDVSVLDGDTERRIPVATLAPGMRFVVRPGEKIATDGIAEDGASAVDRSLMTGESAPVDVLAGDAVTGGTVALTGRLVVRATCVGADTQLGHMLDLVERAQNAKAAVQHLADRISAVFVPIVIVLSVATLSGWLLSGASSLVAFNAALSVLIIACPCALGLATPAALFVASGTGARRGIFFKGYKALEVSRQIDTVVLDKTGTVTEGRMTVVGVAAAPESNDDEVLRIAGSLEAASEHPIARAVAVAGAAVGPLAPVTSFRTVPGVGTTGVVEGLTVEVGRSPVHASDGPALPDVLAARRAEWEGEGRTVVVVRRGGSALGVIAVADALRPSAAPAVRALQAMGMRCVLVSGDNEPTVRAVGAAIGVDDVLGAALPGDKVAYVRRLQAEGHSVAVVGDGMNDAPALSTADLGLAIGSGTDVAIDAADLIVVRDDLRVVATALELARRTLRTIRSNLLWAFAYNVIAVPVAALGLLDPLVAGGAMAISSAFVVWNSSRLRDRRPVAHSRSRHGEPRAVAGRMRATGTVDVSG